MSGRRTLTALLIQSALLCAQNSDAGGVLEPVVLAAFATGFGRPLSGPLCTALGITEKGVELPVEQLSATEGDTSRSFNVSRHRGSLDIVMSRRTPKDLIVLRGSSEGGFVRAIRVKEGGSIENLPGEDAAPEFERERAWWLETWLKQQSGIK